MRPLEMVFLSTTARLGPGDIAPTTHISDIPKVISHPYNVKKMSMALNR